ncbi:L,D-transpeptidase [Catellatospora tritici]|uniref:L,D-transpeptidase n=1 Tax=Catellatospora tritici TaxID=2851566 RepID=UPI001C2CE8B8|nr:Ig-like domain-containing protein [Catellatospora tritici]MBV1855285.1 L,D-transpeptidase family protein [Catellatospora tritici]
MTGGFKRRARRPWAHRAVAALALLVTAPLLLTGCSAEDEKPPTFVQTAPSASPSVAPVPLSLALSPAVDAKNQPASTEIGTKLTGGQVQSVTLTESGGAKVAGKMRADGSSWVPDKPLKYGKKYAATVVAAAPDGQTVTQQTSFTTMGKPGKRGGSGLYLFADREYGVAMPVVVEFTKPIADSARAAVEKRLFVTTDPPQPGVWHWTGPQQVMYRAPEYWQPGTKIKVRVAFEGVPLGGGRYGDQDRFGEGNISKDKVELFVDNANKQMRVMKNGTLLKTLPVSLGKPSTPSSSGTMVIMDKLVKTVFDTTGQPGVDHYRVDIEYAQRLTWNGEYIHAAPWSVANQGKRNVSHGCVNVSMANAKYLFNLTHIGDPVTVKGTERQLKSGNGFTAWDLTWDEYVKGSALPVPADVATAGGGASPSPEPSASPAPAASPTA